MGITGWGHAAIKVKDLDASLAFYRDTLDFSEMMRLHKDDGSVMLVYLRITDHHYLEVFPGAETDRAPGPNANGLNHMCLTVEQLEDTVAKLEAAGAKITVAPKTGLDGNRQAWLEDPDGNRIELMEMGPDCMQYEAIRSMGGTV
jgi:lactoylglutathione lyase